MAREAIFRHRTHNHRTKRDSAATAYYRSARSQVRNETGISIASAWRRRACRRSASLTLLLRLSLLALVLSSGISACGNGSVRSPFHVDAGSEAGAAGAPDTDGGLNLGEDAGDPTLGG